MSRQDGRCPFCGESLDPSSSTCSSCRRNIFQSQIDDLGRDGKTRPRPPSIALTPRNLVIGGIVLLLIVAVPLIAFLSLSKTGSSQTVVKTVIVHDQSTQAPSLSTSTATPVPQVAGSQVETWIGTLTQGSTIYYVELHVTSFGQNAAFQGTWCADMTSKTDLYGHSVCTDSVPISGTWVAFDTLGTGLQADINNKYPSTMHDTVIIWSGQGNNSWASLCQDCRYYSFMQNNQLQGLAYYVNDLSPNSIFSITLQGGGSSKLGT